jgi:hypothetical protein
MLQLTLVGQVERMRMAVLHGLPERALLSTNNTSRNVQHNAQQLNALALQQALINVAAHQAPFARTLPTVRLPPPTTLSVPIVRTPGHAPMALLANATNAAVAKPSKFDNKPDYTGIVQIVQPAMPTYTNR